MDGTTIFVPRRDFDHGLPDHNRDRIQIATESRQSETLRLQWNGTATREGIVDRRKLSATALSDLNARPLNNLLVRRVLPNHQIFNDLEQPLPFILNCLVGREAFGITAGIIDHLCEQHSSTCRQRPSRPPRVKRRWMSVPDRLLACRCRVDGLKRDRDLDEFLFVVIGRGHKPACRLRGEWSFRHRRAARADGVPSSRQAHPPG